MRKVLTLIILILVSSFAWGANSCHDIYKPNRYNLDNILDTVNPFELLQSRILGTSHHRLAPPQFFQPKAGEIIVGINGVSKGEMYQKAADYMTGHSFANGENIHQMRAHSPKDMINDLLQVYEQHGSISKFVISAHGEPGSMKIGGVDFNRFWVSENLSLIKSLPYDLFTPDAQIVLVSCSCARGITINPGSGIRDLKYVFQGFLKQGGEVIASSRYVDPQFHYIPSEYKSRSQRVFRHLISPISAISGVFEYLFSDWKSKFNRVLRIKIQASN